MKSIKHLLNPFFDQESQKSVLIRAHLFIWESGLLHWHSIGTAYSRDSQFNDPIRTFLGKLRVPRDTQELMKLDAVFFFSQKGFPCDFLPLILTKEAIRDYSDEKESWLLKYEIGFWSLTIHELCRKIVGKGKNENVSNSWNMLKLNCPSQKFITLTISHHFGPNLKHFNRIIWAQQCADLYSTLSSSERSQSLARL